MAVALLRGKHKRKILRSPQVCKRSLVWRTERIKEDLEGGACFRGRARVFLLLVRGANAAVVLCVSSAATPQIRPENLAKMKDLFMRLHEKAVKETGGSVECSKALMGRGSAATTGVEGFYSIADGVQIMHMFLLRPEGPGDVADMLLFCEVSRGH